MDSKQRWERVLKTVEADARRAEALLAALAAQDEAKPEPAESTTLAIPTSWLLPTADVSEQRELVDPVEAFTSHEAEALPDFDEMPEVPEELSERILAIRTRIMELQAELTAALSEWKPAPAAPPTVRRLQPQFVDRQL
ncbi:MAG TPA: hypothetical protein VGL26_09630 [Jatrophihabitans sp.]|jgi:hypothetical protein